MSDLNLINLKLPSWYYKKIEKAVVRLYKELDIHSIPIDPFSIAKGKGYILKPFSSMSENARTVLRINKMEGLSYYNPEEKAFIIYYDDSIGFSRVRFTIMHEVGHIIMGHKEESDLAKKIADYFAAYALAPSPLIYHLKCEDYITLADTFVVSRACADYSFQRYNNWIEYGGDFKRYELDLISLFSSN